MRWWPAKNEGQHSRGIRDKLALATTVSAQQSLENTINTRPQHASPPSCRKSTMLSRSCGGCSGHPINRLQCVAQFLIKHAVEAHQVCVAADSFSKFMPRVSTASHDDIRAAIIPHAPISHHISAKFCAPMADDIRTDRCCLAHVSLDRWCDLPRSQSPVDVHSPGAVVPLRATMTSARGT